VEQTVVALNKLWYSYPGSPEPALKDVSFSIRAGERIALLGANGSGKSTLLNCINGLVPLPPHDPLFPPLVVYDSSGGVLNPADEEDLEKIRRRFGTVLQNPDDQIISSVVEDDTAFGPENLGLGGAELRERVAAVLKRCSLEKYKDRAPQFLSGGERQRLALAGVLALDTDIIALDEAVSMLDPQGREDFLALLDELCSGGKTIIQITHDLEEAFRCSRCLVLYRGRLVFDGPPAALLEKPELEAWGFVLPEPARFFRLLHSHVPDISPDAFFVDGGETAARLAAGMSAGQRFADTDGTLAPAARFEPAQCGTADVVASAVVASATVAANAPAPETSRRAAGHRSIVSFYGVSHVYREGTGSAAPGIRGVSFEITKTPASCGTPGAAPSGAACGQVLALIGRSGSGKSTVLKHINALLLPSPGTVWVLGKDTLDRTVKLSGLREQAILSVQNPESALFERYLADDVAFGPKNSGLRGHELLARVKSAMDKTGLSFADFANRETRSLSGGEKRRAALAGLAAMESTILLLDEPLAALDGIHQNKILAMIREFREQGKTIIISTHSMETAAAADLVGIMAEGTLAAFGPPREIFGRRWDPRWGLRLPWAAGIARLLAERGRVPSGAIPLTAEELADLVLHGKAPVEDPLQADRPAETLREKTRRRGRKRRKTGIEFFRHAGGRFLGRPSALLNLGAGTKLLVLLAAAAAALAGPPPFFPLGVLIAVLAAGRFAGKIGPLYLLRGLVPLSPWLLILGGASLVYSEPRFDYMRPLSLILRVSALMTLISLYAAVTSPREILHSVKRFFSALSRFCLPGKMSRNMNVFMRDLSLAASITARFVPVLTEEAERIVTAQLSRGGKKGRLGMALSMIIPLFLRALERAEILVKAMMLRCYR
jgi:energy-coupling factor transport system ATP-binding protein